MNDAIIRLHIESLEGGDFLATSPDVPGLVAEGRSVTEAVEIAQSLARKIAESCIEHGDPLPEALRHQPCNHAGKYGGGLGTSHISQGVYSPWAARSTATTIPFPSQTNCRW